MTETASAIEESARVSTTTLQDEIAAYDQMRDILETEHFGRWVVVHDRKLVGSYDDFQEAAEAAVEQFGRGPYLIKKVGEGPVTLPASALYMPVHA